MTDTVQRIIREALEEDIGPGDLTSLHFLDEDRRATARLVARETCVLAGAEVAAGVFRLLDSRVAIHMRAQDGDSLAAGDVVLEAAGPARSVLSAERTALNFVQRLSGVATLTRRFVDAVADADAVILDTRKTTPGLRVLEKAAVVAGGGRNHRMGLYDAVMLKDNHLPLAGGMKRLQEKITRFREAHPGVMVELEADTIEQVRTFLEFEGVDVILLDNMSPLQLRECVERRGVRPVKLEASGGVNLASVGAIAASGVDYISVGAITHSACSIDFGLDIGIEN